ncbi:MAG TPA: tetratricopeptide repeat protein [Kofleriaceae bacterium]|nr:tetratricopeptide repeat protein [Kofleriaceae bacterium]
MKACIAILALMATGCPGASQRIVHAPDDDRTKISTGTLEAPGEKEDSEPPSVEVAAAPPPARKTVASAKEKRAPARMGERIAGIERSDDEREGLIAPRLVAARSALGAGDLERAISEARRALDLQTDHLGALTLLAEAYYRKGWYPKALRMLRQGTTYAGASDDARLWMLLGLVLDRTEAPLAERMAAYERATKIKPNYSKAWNNLGVVHLHLQQYTGAIAALETAVSIDPDSAAAFINLATAYRRQAFEAQTAAGKRTELLRKAERGYRTAIALDEDQAAGYLDLGLLYLDTDTFPGMSPEQRLQAAVRYLREYKQRRSGASGGPDVDAYLQAAQRQLDGRQRQTRGKK